MFKEGAIPPRTGPHRAEVIEEEATHQARGRHAAEVYEDERTSRAGRAPQAVQDLRADFAKTTPRDRSGPIEAAFQASVARHPEIGGPTPDNLPTQLRQSPVEVPRAPGLPSDLPRQFPPTPSSAPGPLGTGQGSYRRPASSHDLFIPNNPPRQASGYPGAPSPRDGVPIPQTRSGYPQAGPSGYPAPAGSAPRMPDMRSGSIPVPGPSGYPPAMANLSARADGGQGHAPRMADGRSGSIPVPGITAQGVPQPYATPRGGAQMQRPSGPPPAMPSQRSNYPAPRPAAGMPHNPNYTNVTTIEDEAAPGSAKGPGSFSRIFLGSLEKYRGKGGDVGTATEEAAAAIAQHQAPADKRARGPTLKLRSPLALVEAVVLTALFPIVGFIVHRDDPLFLNQRFSWIVFAPLLLGLRHGFAPALISAVILDSLIAVAWRTQIVPLPKLPGDTMVGLTALAMLTGQFSDVWKRELVRLDGGFDVVRKQLGELMRSYFLLELSHDRLQERTGKGAPSLRDTMLAVHRAAEGKQKPQLIDLADQMVEIFQTYTMVEVAGLHPVRDGLLSPDPIAVIGRPAKLDPNDEQVRGAITEKRLTYIETGAGKDGGLQRTHLIAVVPVVDAWGKLYGILAIESMPLLAFERRNLEALAILGSHFADVIATGGKDVLRGQKKEFEIRLRRSIRDLADNDVQSTVFALIIRKGGAVSDSIESLFGGTLRALDFPYVQRDKAGNYCIFILLPATDEAGARALGARVERIVRRELNMNLNRAGAFHFFHVLRPEDTVEGVLRLLEGKALLDEGAAEHTYVV